MTRFAFVGLIMLSAAVSRASADPAAARVLQDHKGSVMALSFSRDDSKLATCSRDSTIKVWDVATGNLDHTIPAHENDVYCVAYSPDGRLLASCSGDTTIRFWDARTFEPIRTLQGHTQVVRWIAFSPDGRTLASTGGDCTIRLWDVATGDAIKSIGGHTGVVKMVRFTADGKALVTTGTDATIRTWDIETGRQTAVLEGHTSSIEGVAISPDGSMFVSNSNDTTVRTWDARSRQPLLILLGHTFEADSATFTPDSRTVISGSKDKTIRFWDAQSGLLLHTLTGHTGRIESMEISHSGKLLATGGGGGDTSVRIWQLPAIDDATRRAAAATRPAVAREPASRALAPDSEATLAAEIDKLWRLIGNDDGDDVHVAQRELVALGDRAVPQLARRLEPRPADGPEIGGLIAQLDSPDPRVRERVTCDLIQIGPQVEQPVRAALNGPVSNIVRHRLEIALRDVTLKDPGVAAPAATLLRESSAIQALKEIGTPAAIELLNHLAAGDQRSRLTTLAREALAR